MISFRDIEQLFSPISEHHFSHGSSPELEELYNEIFSLEKGQRKRLQEDVMAKFDAASQTFKDYDCEDREYLQLFAFISELAFDVYLKNRWLNPGETAPAGDAGESEEEEIGSTSAVPPHSKTG